MPELSEIVGQDAALDRLARAMSGARMPHAYIFAGPEGVGRRTTAAALAKTLLCHKPAAAARADRPGMPALPQACNKCEDCRMMVAGTHPDFHLVYKELAGYHDEVKVRERKMQDLGIDVVRSFLIAPAGRAASRGRGKVFVVLEADLMSIAAQNALLKTLEEPPAGVTIILICRQGRQLLPTTLSRCWLVRFGPLPRRFVTDALEAKGVAEPQAEFWAAYTDGSIGRALRLAGGGMYQTKREILRRLAALAGPGGADVSGLGEHLAAVTEKLVAQAVNEAGKAEGPELSKMLASRRAAGAIIELIASAFRDAMKVATGADLPAVHADQPDAIRALAGRFDPTQLAEIIEQLCRYEQLLWRNVNPKIVWDNLAITCASAAPLRL